MNWVTWVITTTLLFMPFVSNGVDVMGKTTYKLTTPDGAAYYFSEPDCVVNIGIQEGFGLPPLDHNTMTVYKQPGALLTSIQIKPRIVTITATLSGSCRLALHQARASLFSALRWNRTNTDPPPTSTLTYTHDGKSVNLKVHYLSDVTNSQGETADVIGVRLIAYDPMWYATSSTTTALDLSDSLAVGYIAGKIDGIWSALVALNAAVNAIAIAPDGTIYAGGAFTDAGGDADADFIAKWNGTTWVALGATPLNNAVYAIEIDPNGIVYAGGIFTDAGGDADADFIAKWNPATATWSALGAAPLSAFVDCIAIGADGTIYAGGNFTNAGGDADADYIAKFSGGAWSALGATPLNGIVQCITIAPDGMLYAGGVFTNAGGDVNADFIAKWNGAAWSALGTTPFNAIVYVIRIALDGMLYAGGSFTNAGGDANADYVAKWDGVIWSALGNSPPNGSIYSMDIADNGDVVIGGQFSTVGGLSLADNLARWTGSAWLPIDIDLPGGPFVYAVLCDGDDLYIGFDTVGAATVSGDTSVVNAGTYDTFSTIAVTGPGTLYTINNATNGKEIIFDLYIAAGEVVTFDMVAKTITSNWRGNMMRYAPILPSSDFATFCLSPDPVAPAGANIITVFMTGTTGASAASITHTNAYLSVDDAVQ